MLLDLQISNSDDRITLEHSSFDLSANFETVALLSKENRNGECEIHLNEVMLVIA
jgi:hypothetical protein